MDQSEFEKVLTQQIEQCEDILNNKAREYGTQDRLHNFRVAAALEDMTMRQALAGMMAKHTVSVYDMARSSQIYPTEIWEEKITDHLNYLFLLRAIVEEESESGSHQIELPY
jgi:hypothetical protein